MRHRRLYGLTRIDRAANRTHGWVVTIQRRGMRYVKHFSDRTHGGRGAAQKAALAYRDELLARYPPMSAAERAQIRKRTNRSGIVGVCRYAGADRKGRKRRWFWVASWSIAPGVHRHRKFSVAKYGDRGAFQRAVAARRAALEKLSE